MSFIRKLFVVLVGLLATCCAPLANHPKHDTIGHMKASTVAFEVESADGDFNTHCSGFFVSETEILTADHCVVGSVVMRLHVDPEIKPLLMEVAELADLRGVEMVYTTSGYIGEIGYNPIAVFKGSVVAEDKDHDLALVKVEKEHPPHLWMEVSLRFGEVGDHVGMMGAPHGVEYSYSEGVVSSIRSKINGIGKEGPFLQVYISTHPGNSGGPIMDLSTGQVVGLLSFSNSQMDCYGFGIASPALWNFLDLFHSGKLPEPSVGMALIPQPESP